MFSVVWSEDVRVICLL